MNVKEFLKQYPQEAEAVAKSAGTSVAYLRQLAGYHRYPSRNLALKLEKASGGRLTLIDLLIPNNNQAA